MGWCARGGGGGCVDVLGGRGGGRNSEMFTAKVNQSANGQSAIGKTLCVLVLTTPAKCRAMWCGRCCGAMGDVRDWAMTGGR